MTKFLNNADIKGYIAQTAVTSYLIKADSTGRLVAAIAGTDYQAPTTALLPTGGTAGQILSKIDGTNYNTQWIDNFAQQLKHDVKLGATIAKGKAVYVSSANGTNMIVSAASNASEATSSKTLGLLETGGVTNDIVKVVTEGLLAGLDTSTATAGDPVWLGTSGNLIFGLANKPVAPAHMVFIGIVTRAQSVNGEIFVKVQNGFELDELHNVGLSSVADGQGLFYESATSLWKNKTIAAVLGYTPANDSAVVHLAGTETITGVKTFSSVINASTLSLNGGTLAGNNIVSMRSNPTGGQFRIEKSDGSLSAYPFYIGVDGTALAYYYNASGALKVLLHTDGTSYFGNSLSVGYSTYAATSYSLDVNGSAQITSTLQVGGNLYGVGATFSSSVTATSLIKSGGTSAQFLKADGSVDSNAYITSSSLSAYLPLTGGTISGDLTISSTNPRLYFTDTDNNPDYFISNTDGTFTIYDVTNSAGKFKIYSTGSFELNGVVGIGTTTTSAEGNLFLGAKSATEGGQLVLQKGTSQTYAAHLDNYVDQFRIIAGTDTTSSALKFTLNLNTGQAQFPNYNSATSFSGTVVGYLAFDSGGNLLTVAGVAATDNTKLPLTGGALTGPLTITGNGSYLGDWGYKTLELNDTSGYAGIFFKNGANIWITRRNGADNAMDWAYSTNATAQGTGTFTQKMRLASDEWWVSTYPGYKMRITGGDVIDVLNGTSVTPLYLQYQANTGGNVNIAASKFIFDNANNRLNFSKTSGTLISHGSMTDAIGYNASYGTYIGSPVGGATYYIYANGSFYDNGTVRTLLHSGNYSSYALPLSGGTMSGILYSTYNTATGIANNGFNTAKTIIGNYHIQNGAGLSGDNKQAAITFQGGSASEAQAGIYVSNNNSSGTAMGFATTDSYATGPQLFMTATNGGVVNFPRAVPTYAGTSLVYNSGTWGINVTGSSRSLLFSGDSAKALLDGLWAGGGSYPGYQFTGGNSRFGFSSTGGVVDVYADGNFYATDSSYLVWHQGNLTNLNQLSNGPGYITSSATVAGLNTEFLGTGSTNISSGYSRVIRNENSNGGNPTYAPVLHLAASDTMWQIAGAHGGSTTLVWRSGYAGNWSTPWWNILHSGNLSSYALPISGGNLTGTLSFSQPVGLSFANGQYIKDNGSGGLVIYSGAALNLNATSVTVNGNGVITSGNIGSQSVNYAAYSGYTTGYSTSVELSGRIWFNGSGYHNVSMYESYGIVMNCVSHPWHVQVLNGSLLVGISASGANYGTGHLYTNGFIRPSGDYGLYSQDYGGVFRRNTNSYGTWESVGYAKNGWGGYVNNNNYIVSWMLNTSGDFGFLTQNGNWWNLFYNNGNNCWGIGTDNTYSGDGFRCIKYGSAQYGWTTWSDRRAKENISTITGALDKVLNMRGVYFNYIIDEAKNKRVGFIAQELQQALPEAVRYAEEIDEYNVEYGQIVSVLAEAVKEHYAKTVAQQIEIEALKTQLQTLLN